MPASGESGRSNNSAVKDSPLTAETHPSSSSLSGHKGALGAPEPHERVERWLGRAASCTPPTIDAASYASRPRGGLLYDPVSGKFVDPLESTHAPGDGAPDGTNDDEARRRPRQVAGRRPLHINMDTSQQTWTSRGGESSLSPFQRGILPPRPPSLPQKPENPYLNSSSPSTRRLARENARPATPTAQHQISSVSTPDKAVSVRSSDERIDRIIQAQDRIFQALHLHNTAPATTTPTYQQTSLPHMPSYHTVGSGQSYEPAMPGLPYPSGYTSPVSSSPIRSPYGHLSPVSQTQSTTTPPGRSPAFYNRADNSLADQAGRSWQLTVANSPVRQWTSNDSRVAYYTSAPFPAEDSAVTQTASPPGPNSMAWNFDPTAKEFIPSNPQADSRPTGDPSAKGRGAVH